MNISPINFINLNSVVGAKKISFKGNGTNPINLASQDSIEISREAKEEAEIKAKGEEILEKSKAVLEYAKKLHLQVEDVIVQGMAGKFKNIETDDKIIEFHFAGETLIILEYDKSNPDKTLRESQATRKGSKYQLNWISECQDDKEDIYFYNMSSAKLQNFQQGYEELPDGTYKINQEMHFFGDKLTEYQNGYTEDIDEVINIDERMLFYADESINLYQKGFIDAPDTFPQAEKEVVYPLYTYKTPTTIN